MHRNRAPAGRRRAGYLTPALAMALLTAFLVGAAVLNVGWRRAAEREAATAADAAALAAAGELACDERLLDLPLPQDVLARVAARAEELASRQTIAGVTALPVPGGPQVGQRVTGEDGRPQLLETGYRPSVVAVTVQRGREGRLPWLFRAGGHTAAPLTATAEASIDGKVAALRPRSGGSVPVWPLAVLSGMNAAEAVQDSAAPVAGWRDQVEMELGGDRYSYDRETGQVVERPDGLPELVVLTLAPGGDVDDVGLILADVGQTFGAGRLDAAMRDGLGAEDLELLGGEVPVMSLPSSPVVADALPRLPIEAERNLTPGDARAIFLYEDLTEAGGRFTARLVGVVAARLMDLQTTGGGWRATFQPAVLATGTAVLADADDAEAADNRYLYKVRLTR